MAAEVFAHLACPGPAAASPKYSPVDGKRNWSKSGWTYSMLSDRGIMGRIQYVPVLIQGEMEITSSHGSVGLKNPTTIHRYRCPGRKSERQSTKNHDGQTN